MRRLFWVGVGVAATVVVARRGRSWVEARVPAGAVTTAESVAAAIDQIDDSSTFTIRGGPA